MTKWQKCSEAGFLCGQITQFGCLRKHRGPIAMPSYYNTMATRRYCDGFTTSCCLPKTIGQLRVSFVLSSGDKNARCRRWLHEANTNKTRWDKMHSRWHHEGQDGHTNSTRTWTFVCPSGNSLACQRFWKRSRCYCRTQKNQPMATRWCKMA